ncbi:hypothetical protein R1X32_08595 (plasmid) [Rhodococcus opacus]|nr:hypothetical protein HJ581_0039690 [Rhodococcus opacus]
MRIFRHVQHPLISGVAITARTQGSLTGTSPVDQGKEGIEGQSCRFERIPLSSTFPERILKYSTLPQSAIPTVKSKRGPRRRKPGKPRAGKDYNYQVRRRWLREQGIIPRIARRG